MLSTVSCPALTCCKINYASHRLQNSPYFCVFKYTRAVKQKVWNEAESRERDWGETPKIRTVGFFLSSRLTRFVRVRLLAISLLILRKKPTVLQSTLVMNTGHTYSVCDPLFTWLESFPKRSCTGFACVR